MPYHIDEENSELLFEVYDGNKLIIHLKPNSGSGSGGCDIYIIKSGDDTEPTESNVFSARRTLLSFLRKDSEDTTEFLLRLLGGIITPFIESPDFISGVLGAGFSIKQNENKQSVAEFDKLIVRLKATFQMLEILKTELGGSDMLFNSSGAKIKITRVERLDQESFFITDDKAYFSDGDEAYFPDVFRCYFLSDDTEEAVENLFHAEDFAWSKSFNIKEGVYENVGNHYWWRKVVGVGDDYIELSTVDMDTGSDEPKEGDVVVQLGNYVDSDRQNAIVLSAFGENAPYISMFQGIDTYSFSDKSIFTVGYDKVNKECYLKNFGRTYIGDHNNKHYFDLSREGLVIKASKFIFDTGEDVSDEFEKVKASISAMDGKISLKVSNNDLASTGIDINKKTVTVTSERFFVNNSNGTPIAVFTTDSNGKPVLKSEYIDVENLKVKHLDGADGTFSGELKAATGTFTGGVITNSDGNRIILDPNSRQMSLVSSTGTILSSWFFYNNSGYESAAISLNNVEGESLYIYPFDIRMNSGDKSTQITNGDVRLKMGTSSMVITPIQISITEGGNVLTGFTGSFVVDSLLDESNPIGTKVWKKISVKNGIIYKVENMYT